MWKNKVLSALATSTHESYDHGDARSGMSLPPYVQSNTSYQLQVGPTKSRNGTSAPSTISPSYHSFDTESIVGSLSNQPPEAHVPIPNRIFAQLLFLSIFQFAIEIQMCAMAHTDLDTLAFRVLFLPLVYYIFYVYISLSILFRYLPQLLQAGYYGLTRSFQICIALPMQIHALIFAIMGAMFACSTTDAHENSHRLYIQEKTKETLSIILWSATHLLEQLFWASLIRICILHNKWHKLPDGISKKENENFMNVIREQQSRITKFEQQLKTNSVHITRLKQHAKAESSKDGRKKLSRKERIQIDETIQNLEAEYRFLATSVAKKLGRIDSEEETIREVSRTVRRLQVKRSKNDSTLEGCGRQLQALEQANCFYKMHSSPDSFFDD